MGWKYWKSAALGAGFLIGLELLFPGHTNGQYISGSSWKYPLSNAPVGREPAPYELNIPKINPPEIRIPSGQEPGKYSPTRSTEAQDKINSLLREFNKALEESK